MKHATGITLGNCANENPTTNSKLKTHNIEKQSCDDDLLLFAINDVSHPTMIAFAAGVSKPTTNANGGADDDADDADNDDDTATCLSAKNNERSGVMRPIAIAKSRLVSGGVFM